MVETHLKLAKGGTEENGAHAVLEHFLEFKRYYICSLGPLAAFAMLSNFQERCIFLRF
jgi:hypothetical protein